MKLEEGDIILTGTPEGVGPVKAGQTLTGILTDEFGKVLDEFQFPVINRQ